MKQTTTGLPRKFMFLYLNTGNGHIAQARVLKKAMEEVAPDVPVELVNGFDKKNVIGHLFFEKGYGAACNYVPGSFPLLYDIGQHRTVLTFFVAFVGMHTANYIQKVIETQHITDVVSFHFALTPSAVEAISKVERKVNLSVVVTDPFTGPNAWFYKRQADYLVASQEMKDVAIHENKVNPTHVHVVPVLVDKKFRKQVTEEEKRALRRQYGFDENKKVVLLAGGGEGLPGAMKIINQCVIHKAKFTVAVVCGRNTPMQQSLDIFAKTYPQLDLHVFGFVNYMDSLIKLSDLVVSKAGTSTVMEIAASHKPLIISNYIHNQELGNMRFIVQNHVGYYIRHSADIYKKIEEIFASDESYTKAIHSFGDLKLDTDAEKIARYILEK